jgi:hypothetical protein
MNEHTLENHRGTEQSRDRHQAKVGHVQTRGVVPAVSTSWSSGQGPESSALWGGVKLTIELAVWPGQGVYGRTGHTSNSSSYDRTYVHRVRRGRRQPEGGIGVRD